MVKQLACKTIYVTGASCSAIYDFNNGNVYSINKEGTQILNSYIANKTTKTKEEALFTSKVKELLNIQKFDVMDYVFPDISPKKLNHVWLEVTQVCTHMCVHCYEGLEHFEIKNPLTFIEWKKVIDDVSSFNCKSIQFIGGEPTLYMKLPELIFYAKSKGIDNISVFSNLYFLTEELIDAIVANSVTVHFSIYGSSDIIHDGITNVEGSFNKLNKNVKILKNKHVYLIAHVVVMKENEKDRDNIFWLLKSIGLVNIKYDEIRKVYGGCQNKHLVQNSRVLMTKPNFKTSESYFNNAYYNNTCWYGKCVVSTDGTVYPCEFERNIKYGNVRSRSITNIISSKVVDKYWYLDFSKIDICKDCEFRFACKDCRPTAFGQNGFLTDKNPRCKYNPYNGTWIV